MSSFSLEDVSGLWDCGPASPGAGFWPWLWPWNGGGVSLSMPPVNTKPVCCMCVGMSWVGPVSTVDGCSSAVFQSGLDVLMRCSSQLEDRRDGMAHSLPIPERSRRQTNDLHHHNISIGLSTENSAFYARRIVAPYVSTNHRSSW